MGTKTAEFIKIYLTKSNDELLLYLNRLSRTDRYHKCFRLLVGQREINTSKADNRAILGEFVEVIQNPPAAVDLFAVMVCEAAYMALNNDLSHEAARLLKCLAATDTKKLMPIVRAYVLNAEAVVSNTVQNFNRMVEKLEEISRLRLPHDYMPWIQCSSNLVLFYIASAEFQKASDLLEKLAAEKASVERFLGEDVEILLKAALLSACGKTDAALETLARIRADLHTRFSVRYLGAKGGALVRKGQIAQARECLDALRSIFEDTKETQRDRRRAGNVMICLDLAIALAGREYERARRAVRDFFRTHPMKIDNEILTYLAGIELAAKNPRAARCLLQTIDNGAQSKRLQVEWARLNLLEGDRAAALDHFRNALALKMPEFIEKQLLFAHELTPADVAWLFSAAQAEHAATARGKPPAVSSENGRADIPSFVGASDAAIAIRHKIATFAGSDKPVLVTGQTGTGKEIVARLLHVQSGRADRPFLAVDCGSLSDTLIAAEFFGYRKGAFTGADGDYEGIFLAAGDGTIFLDEITSASPAVQAALLRAIETRTIRPVGEAVEVEFRARLIFAANQPLESLVDEGKFRRDLFYRINRLAIHIPPLRSRPTDIPELARHFIRAIPNGEQFRIGPGFMESLDAHPWPGNVRELRNLVERIVLLKGDSRTLDGSDVVFDGRKDELASPVDGNPLPDAWKIIPGTQSACRRRELILRLIGERGSVTRAEVQKHTNCSPNTATADLRALLDVGLIRRVQDTRNVKSSRFLMNTNVR